MTPLHYDADHCVMTKFSALIAGKWKPILLHLVEKEVNRFNLLQQQMPSISRKVLAEQLRELEADGLLTRTVLKAKAPQVVVYGLTEKGRSLRRLIDTIIGWCTMHLKEHIPDELVPVYAQHYPELAGDLFPCKAADGGTVL
ncbi:helix-turn-helix domain-containing protein [Paraflavitalea sp. CAU 1676]|jgi:DNA-binding HxlR family transcriptional regulator|uniref:winged helix-turn-helix transcriptional regulator n=1 Tax=Paraflavitalea sp. CAU 1676 TaxID=3032598 RepID=UPI0023DA7641|nr:helix-turn-helix domain-containing protein [Paraflavitalea sp. CAU 1676]MDF2190383.1 helix-turn-helix domain-containing protein [Paraflavitalea sp. CAU 1676]